MGFYLLEAIAAITLALLSIATLQKSKRAVDESIPIARLVLRNCEVVISTKAGVTRYDVRSQDTQLLHTDLTAEQLRASCPEIYDELRAVMTSAESEAEPSEPPWSDPDILQ